MLRICRPPPSPRFALDPCAGQDATISAPPASQTLGTGTPARHQPSTSIKIMMIATTMSLGRSLVAAPAAPKMQRAVLKAVRPAGGPSAGRGVSDRWHGAGC